MDSLLCWECGQPATRVYFTRHAYPPHVALSAEDPKLSCEPCWKRTSLRAIDRLGTWPFPVIGQWSQQQLGYITSPKFSAYNHFHLSEQWSKRLYHIWYRYRPTGKAHGLSPAIP